LAEFAQKVPVLAPQPAARDVLAEYKDALVAPHLLQGGKPSRFLYAVRELQEAIKSRFRRSSPVKGIIYFVGPAAARLAQAGTLLREAGRKGELVRVYR